MKLMRTRKSHKLETVRERDVKIHYGDIHTVEYVSFSEIFLSLENMDII